jgi:putative tricarboxylic transport membrane protein
MDNLTGAYRFTFAIRDLFDGIGFVPVAMGMFGIGEILSATEDTLVHEFYQPRLRELLPNRQEFRASIGPILRGSGLGFFVGLLPGSAHVLSSFLSYIVEKRLASRPEEFGTGRIEGVAGPETANNAATGGAMVPFLALGIPTGPAIAVMMIALLVPHRQHVYRKCHPGGVESAPGGPLCQPPPGSFSDSFPDHPPHLPDRDLFHQPEPV